MTEPTRREPAYLRTQRILHEMRALLDDEQLRKDPEAFFDAVEAKLREARTPPAKGEPAEEEFKRRIRWRQNRNRPAPPRGNGGLLGGA